jgi:hypothetical protein
MVVASLADNCQGDIGDNLGSSGRWKGQLRLPEHDSDELQIVELAGCFAYYSCSESGSWWAILHGSMHVPRQGWHELAAGAPSYRDMS